MLTKGMVVLITGAGQGIGRATALAFAREGASVVVVADINETSAKATAGLVSACPGATGVGLKLDVADRTAVEGAVKSIADRQSRIDVLVNNAGICQAKTDFEAITGDDYHRSYDINLVGAANCMAAVLPYMKANKSGRIISLASLAAHIVGLAVAPTYSCAKAAVICLTKSAARQFAPFGIRVNAVAPGFIRTAMTAGFAQTHDPSTVPLGRLGEPEDVADVIVFLASDYARYITGATIDINGGLFMN
jgi:3-oxoacyl-[acyl-carrier protein] reductase